MNDILKSLAPTLASALLGPLGGVAVATLGEIFGIEKATISDVTQVFQSGKLTPEQLSVLKELELKYQAEEKERGFRYSELEFKDRDSARSNNVSGGVQLHLFYLSLLLLGITLGTEVWVLFKGYPVELPEIIVGRVLGLMDAVAMMVLAYWYGTTNGSAQKTYLLSQTDAIK